MTAHCECQTCELLRTYDRVCSYGHIELGDASERCAVCGLRERSKSYYVWLPGPRPVCSYECGRILRGRREAEAPASGVALGPSAPTEPLPSATSF